MRLDWRWQISNHDQFEELCALAAGGEIAPDDWQSLKAHLDECARCRGVFTEMGEIHATWLPEHPDFQIRNDEHSNPRLRKAILKRATREGAHFSRSAYSSTQPTEASIAKRQSSRVWVLATAASVLMAFATGAVLVQLTWLRRNATKPLSAQMPSVAILRAAAGAPKSERLETPHTSGRGEAEAAPKKVIEQSSAEQTKLRQQLADQKRRAASLEQSNSEATRLVVDLKQQLEAAQATQSQAEAELAGLKSMQATSEAITIAQQQEIRQLKERLADQSASVDREQQLLSAGREIRDLIAARNLHIIDVYDTDGKGRTSRAFGRVFYSEGKSLVFYAYDLNPHQPESAKYAFYVWGKRDGAPQNIKNLGALSKDDQVQKRWVLTITDPKVLAEIDSVFITLEPADKPGKQPSGKRLLTAFVGSAANHP